MKKRVNKFLLRIKPYVPFILLFLICLVMHYGIHYTGDDAINHNVVTNQNQIKYLIYSYNHWTSRIFIYFINNIFYMLPIFFWKVIDSIIIVIGAICISKLFNSKNNFLFDCVICLLVSLFPFLEISPAGFIATTLTYYWPIVFLLICLLPVKKILNNEKIKNYMFPIYFILLLYATDGEQISVLLLCLSICFIIYQKIIKKEKINWYLICLLVLSILKIIFIKTCPGNNVRSLAEASLRFPLYNTLSLFDKIYMGVIYTTNVNIISGLPIFILALFLCILTNLVNKNRINIIFSNLLLVMVSSITVFNKIIQTCFPGSTKYIEGFGNMIFSSKYHFSMSLSMIALVLYCGLLYLLIINLKKEILPVILYLGGLMTQFMMAFSPTIYASGLRTGSIMFYSILIIDFLLYKKIDSLLTDTKRNFILTFLILISAMCFIKFVVNI